MIGKLFFSYSSPGNTYNYCLLSIICAIGGIKNLTIYLFGNSNILYLPLGLFDEPPKKTNKLLQYGHFKH